MSLKSILVKTGLIKSRSKNRNRHDHQLFKEIWRSSHSIEEVAEKYSKFTPVTLNQVRGLYFDHKHRLKLQKLPLRKERENG